MRTIFIAIATLLLTSSASASSAVQEALCTAAETGTPADIAAALKKGAKVDAICDSLAERALDAAITSARTDNMEALIKAGAKVKGGTAKHPIVPLAYVRNASSAQLLLKYGANANAVDDLGATPLFRISSNLNSNFSGFYQMTERDAIDIAALLIAHGADVNFADKSGDTVLIGVALNCEPQYTEFLIAHGANVNAKNKFGETTLGKVDNVKDMDPKCGPTEQVLLSHGAVKSP